MSITIEETPRLTDVPELIPARMLNEFAYCPRLAYLEWVQGEFADNLETLEGRFGHRRVDQESSAPLPTAGDCPDSGGKDIGRGRPSIVATMGPSESDPSAEDAEDSAPSFEPIHGRSVMLSAPDEGLIAKIDVLDLSSAEAVPVDYKRGKAPDLSEGAWEPERVQLCAQGLILRENGYHCQGGFLYFIGSRRRVSIPFDEPLVERTRELIRAMRNMAAAGAMPPPLVESPKCPRCSLAGICLPDETCFLRTSEQGNGHGEVRRLMPARQEATPLYVQEQGASVGKSGEQLTVSFRRETICKTRLLDVSQLCLLGNVQVSAQALREITARGIPVCHFSYGGWFHAITTGLGHNNVELRIAQFATANDPAASLRLAGRMIDAKIRNCRTLLRRHLEADSDNLLPQLARLASQGLQTSDAASLLGIEGTAARVYFGGLARLFKGPFAFNMDGRNRRPPRDPVNAMLSFVYAMLVKELTVAVQAVGFDPMLGVFHRPRYGRPSLALDLAEEFRPLIGDSVVLTLVNNGEVTPASFVSRAGAVALTPAGRKAVLKAFERRLETLVTHPLFGYRISYRRILEVQARLLARTVLGELAEYPGFCTR